MTSDTVTKFALMQAIHDMLRERQHRTIFEIHERLREKCPDATARDVRFIVEQMVQAGELGAGPVTAYHTRF